MCNSLCMLGLLRHTSASARLLLKMPMLELHPRHTEIAPFVVGPGSEFLEDQPGNFVI